MSSFIGRRSASLMSFAPAARTDFFSKVEGSLEDGGCQRVGPQGLDNSPYAFEVTATTRTVSRKVVRNMNASPKMGVVEMS